MGTEFALPFLTNYNLKYRSQFKLFITASQDKTKVTVSVLPLKFKEERTLKAGERFTAILPPTVIHGTETSPNTVLIAASAKVSVTALNYKDYTAETSVLYPVTEWGRDYFMFTPSSLYYNEFSVTNGKEKNRVEFLAKDKIVFHQKTLKHLIVELQPYESVQFHSEHDLSSIRVVSQHPVAVFTGHTCFNKFSRCDHLYEQLLPVNRWGSKFIVPPLSTKNKYVNIYLQSSQPTHIVIQSGNTKNDFSLSAGETKELKPSKSEALSIQADHGIQVLLLFNGITYPIYKYRDPFLMTIMPSDQFCSSFSLVAQDIVESIALIVAQTSALAELRFNGKDLPASVQWKKVTGTEFSWAEISYPLGNSQHTVSSSKTPFGLYSISLDQRIGYGSPAQCLQPGKEKHTG